MKILNIEKKTPSNVIMEELSKKNTKGGTSQVDIASYAALANELRKHGISIKDAADILGVPRSRFYPHTRRRKETAMVLLLHDLFSWYVIPASAKLDLAFL